MRVLDLFSGIGGFSLGLERTGRFKTVAFCEPNEFCRRVLQKNWPATPIFEDVRKLRGDDVGTVDVVSGGFPCQDLSISGNRAGISGKRSGLWSEFARIIGEIRPRFALVENVTGLLDGERGSWMGRVLGDLAELRYDAEWFSLPAAAFGAPHWRYRVFILAYPNSKRREKCVLPTISTEARQREFRFSPVKNGVYWPKAEPPILSRNHGVPGDLDTIRAVGNSVFVPLIEKIGLAIADAYDPDADISNEGTQ